MHQAVYGGIRELLRRTHGEVLKPTVKATFRDGAEGDDSASLQIIVKHRAVVQRHIGAILEKMRGSEKGLAKKQRPFAALPSPGSEVRHPFIKFEVNSCDGEAVNGARAIWQDLIHQHGENDFNRGLVKQQAAIVMRGTTGKTGQRVTSDTFDLHVVIQIADPHPLPLPLKLPPIPP